MDSVPILLVTANVGSIFDDPTQMLKQWVKEFLLKISKLKVKFIALHCQEVGGKHYENSMKHVNSFISLLQKSDELKHFTKSRIFLDEDFSSVPNFTALGSLYFIHESLDASIWDFEQSKFIPITDTQIFSGNIEAVPIKEKAKFPQAFFPECKWSRKGFMRTRWSISGTVFDLVNIHLFHDASNLVAMSAYPSVYCKNRRHALEHTLHKFHNDQYDNVPYFVFGDFNFRTDTEGVIKKLTSGLTKTRVQNTRNNDHTKLQFTNQDDNLVLSIGKKEFSHSDHETIFVNYDWLRMFDKETEAFKDILSEYPINFAPSYPFEEQLTKASSYMPTRCPAWCDRVLLSNSAKKIVNEEQPIEYGLMGLHTCMGDHKPVFLKVKLNSDAGIVRCCDSAPFVCLPEKCQCYRTLGPVPINIVDMSDYIIPKPYPEPQTDSKFLHPTAGGGALLEPYTPESSASRSPFSEENDAADHSNQRRNSLCPAQLKNKLENILLSTNADESIGVQQSLVDDDKSNPESTGDISCKTQRVNTAKNSSIVNNIEYKRFSFIRFRKKSRKKSLSCIEATCSIA
ncbi:inositol polyphosphate-5-phosphatase A isoform X1 [Rhynchophorus ferrugineus]|uniref:inositol polyphosphate-5-phosphatase A isoform X1 n=1 Tax=Rhynchophorus ferrugineus TaxID=354439 RepID=UPI003FCCE3B9